VDEESGQTFVGKDGVRGEGKSSGWGDPEDWASVSGGSGGGEGTAGGRRMSERKEKKKTRSHPVTTVNKELPPQETGGK